MHQVANPELSQNYSNAFENLDQEESGYAIDDQRDEIGSNHNNYELLMNA